MENGWFTVKNLAEKNDGVYLEVVPTRRYMLEEMVESPDEVSLNRHVRQRLRKSMNQVTEALAVDVAEVYSPPRVTTAAKRLGLSTGVAVDKITGYMTWRVRRIGRRCGES